MMRVLRGEAKLRVHVCLCVPPQETRQYFEDGMPSETHGDGGGGSW